MPFDTLIDNCPGCGNEIYAQTKLGRKASKFIKKYEPFETSIKSPNIGTGGTFLFQLKQKCDCGADLIARIQKRTFIGFTQDAAQIQEAKFGRWFMVEE